MKRLEFDVKHGHYAHPDGRWVTYDDAIALARRVAVFAWLRSSGKGPQAEDIDAILALFEDTIKDAIEAVTEQRDTAVRMLAEWCVAIDQCGTGWDDWDEHYKDAMYRDGPLRALLDAAIDAAMKGAE